MRELLTFCFFFLVSVSSSLSEPSSAERSALVDLYESTNGESWDSKRNWNVTNISSDPCTWFGVVCDSGNNSVVSLGLSNNNLNGTIPLSLGNLTNLVNLYLFGNNLRGIIPSSFGSLTNLVFFLINNNNLDGTIPSSIVNLVGLYQLNLSNNMFSGTIPSLIGNLNNLSAFIMTGNLLNGTIPPSIGSMMNLTVLDFSFNDLDGPIPPSIGDLSNLQILTLTRNILNGSIPTTIGNLISLQQLMLNSNSLSGSIPSSIGDLANLQRLMLDNNSLSGSIPSSIGDPADLKYLFLSFNDLNGTIPSSIGNLVNLTTLKLENNMLSGTLPSFLQTQPPPPLAVNVSSNQLCCPPPSWCANDSCMGCVFCPAPSKTPTKTQTRDPPPIPTRTQPRSLSVSRAKSLASSRSRAPSKFPVVSTTLISTGKSPSSSQSFPPPASKSQSSSVTPFLLPSNPIKRSASVTRSLNFLGFTLSKSALISPSLSRLGTYEVSSTFQIYPTLLLRHPEGENSTCISACLINITSSSSTKNSIIEVVGNTNSVVGSVAIPPGNSGILSISSNVSHSPTTSQVISLVIDVSLFSDQNGKSQNLSGTIEICIQPNFHTNPKTSCLGYLDLNIDPPRWVCQDSCVSYNSNGNVCGKSDHLTNFAILFFGGQGGCPSDFIFGSYQKDLALVASIAALIIFLGLLVLVISFFPCSNRILYSKEALRIRNARKAKIISMKKGDEYHLSL